jgi:shikimate dehydrogenase
MAKSLRAEITACFGDPVDDNPTGLVEEAAFKDKGLDWRYLLLKVKPDDLEDAVNGAKVLGFKGFNLTMPHKIKVIPYLDKLSEAAEIVGAVNTVIIHDGKMTGENTDGKGWLTSIKEAGLKVKGAQVTVLGAGGAARAIAVESALAGAAKVTIINRNTGRGSSLAELISKKTKAASEYIPWAGKLEVPAGTNILVNATSIGFAPNVNEKPALDYDSITGSMAVSDVIF